MSKSDKTQVDVTKAWQASQGQKATAKRLRIYAAVAWLIALVAEGAGIVFLLQGRFDTGNLPLLIALLIVMALGAMGGSFCWKAANKHNLQNGKIGFNFSFKISLGQSSLWSHFYPCWHWFF